jgi:hypothetical protein
MPMDAFQILGIDRDADTRQIRLAFHRGARTAHPDAGGDPDQFLRLSDAYRTARSVRTARARRSAPAGTAGGRAEDQPTQLGYANRYDLAEIAYRFELARPGRTPRSFLLAVDAELHPGAEPLDPPAARLELISYLIRSKVKTPLIVAAIVAEVDSLRRSATIPVRGGTLTLGQPQG